MRQYLRYLSPPIYCGFLRLVTNQVDLYHELEVISSEYGRDLNGLAGDFLSLALEEAIQHIPKTEKSHLDEVRHLHEIEHNEHHNQACNYDAGGT